jgi:hypothetical protein
MRPVLWLALAAGLVPPAASAQSVVRPYHGHARRLPPVSGTITMAPGEFGRSARPVIVRRSAPMPRIVTGYGYGSGYTAVTPAERWATGGTGLAGLIGNTGNSFAGQAAWGTADSATTGSGYLGGAWAAGAERPLVERYGEPAVFPAGYDVPVFGASPQLGFYGSGAPSTLAYYSSGSSAGPYGSPGGLATYRSGSYGYGPRIITIPRGRQVSQQCSCGPRIIRVGRRHHAVMVD